MLLTQNYQAINAFRGKICTFFWIINATSLNEIKIYLKYLTLKQCLDIFKDFYTRFKSTIYLVAGA